VDGTDVTVIGTSPEGCISAQTVPITTAVNPFPTVTLSSSDPDNEICQGESITFSAAIAGFDSYEFFDGGASVQNSASEIWTTSGLAAGNSITVEATQNGCTSVGSAAVATNIILAPTVNPGSNLDLCVDSPDDTLAGFTPAGGTWVGTGVTDTTGVFSPIVSGIGTFTLSYSVANINCTTTETIDVTVHNLPAIVAGTYGPICDGESVAFTAAGGNTYSWNPPIGLNNANIGSPIASPDTTTSYTVVGTDIYGCVNTDQTTLVIEPVPVASFIGNSVCIGDTLTFENTSTPLTGVAFTWSFGDGQTSTDSYPAVLYQAEGSFDVTMVATLGNCSDDASGTVTVSPVPTAFFTADPTYTTALEPLIHFEAFSDNAVLWSWDYGDGSPLVANQNPAYFFSDTGMQVITLTVFNNFGCPNSIADSVFIAPFATLYVPSAFTPNGDRINDVFYAYGEDINNIDFRIFDRWGRVVFFTDNITKGWDGRDRHTGGEVKPGLYTYQVRYDDYRGRGLKKLGRISLIR
jgi:gliding motility-associated-like protein